MKLNPSYDYLVVSPKLVYDANKSFEGASAFANVHTIDKLAEIKEAFSSFEDLQTLTSIVMYVLEILPDRLLILVARAPI